MQLRSQLQQPTKAPTKSGEKLAPYNPVYWSENKKELGGLCFFSGFWRVDNPQVFKDLHLF